MVIEVKLFEGGLVQTEEDWFQETVEVKFKRRESQKNSSYGRLW